MGVAHFRRGQGASKALEGDDLGSRVRVLLDLGLSFELPVKVRMRHFTLMRGTQRFKVLDKLLQLVGQPLKKKACARLFKLGALG